MKISIWLINTSMPKIHESVVNSYLEDLLFCVQLKDRTFKYPTTSICYIEETI